MTPRLAELDPARLAAAVALAAGVPADSDQHECELMLERVCELVRATTGLVMMADGAARLVLAAHRCGHDVANRPVRESGTSMLQALAAITMEVVATPLRVRDHLVGVLEIGRDAGPFTAADRALLDVVCPRLALLVERHRLLDAERIAREATTEAVATLRLKEERFDAMCDGAFAFIGLTSMDGRVLEVNNGALAFARVTKEAVLGLPFWDTPWWTHDTAQRERLRRAMAASAELGETVAFVATHVAASGEVATVDFSVRPAHGGSGIATYLVVEGRDVTARAAAERSLAKAHEALASRVEAHAGEMAAVAGTLEAAQGLYKAVVETVVDGIVVIDERGTIEWTNTAAAKLFGYSTAHMVGRNVRVLMPDPYEREHDDYLRRYLTTGERRIIGIGREVRGLRQDGSEFPLYLAVGETSINGTRKFTGILRDLTVNKTLERKLQERQTLAQIGELAAVVAHEVRNPLAAIRGVVEVIQTRFPEGASDRKILGDLLARVDSLDHLVSDLLVYARPADLARRPTSMLGLVRDTATVVGSDPAASAVHFEVTGEDAELAVDPAQMSRVLLNLITNAVQAVRHGGVVRIAGERGEGHYRIAIDDDGPGMPPDVVARCLEPFFTTKTRGTGLGLPIARRVVDEHGGTLTVSSEAGRGTRVAVELPLVPTDGPPG